MSFKQFLETRDTNISENAIKYEALENMKQIQGVLGSISFIDVIGVMREDNPLKAEVLEMEDMLHELTVTVSSFINDNLKDAEVNPEADQEAEREEKVDQAVKDAEDAEEIKKKSPDVEEE